MEANEKVVDPPKDGMLVPAPKIISGVVVEDRVAPAGGTVLVTGDPNVDTRPSPPNPLV